MLTIDSQVVAFTLVAALLTLTPGVDTVLVIRNVLTRGRRAGVATTVGICFGLFIHATVSALGLSLILVRSATALEMVKLIGAGYLVWLGIRSFRSALSQSSVSPSTAHGGDGHGLRGGVRRSFIEGLLSNVLNPKVAVFYLAFLPQFISPGDWVLGKSVLLASIHWLEGFLWLVVVTLFVGRLRWWIMKRRVKQVIEATTGAVLVAFGVRLAMERAR
jgi:threonine/homoserine/homoserine lactone efflux protein